MLLPLESLLNHYLRIKLQQTKQEIANHPINLIKMQTKTEQKGFLKKFGKWAPIVGIFWIGLNIIVPLALLRIPAVQKYLVALSDKFPFNLPGVG